MKMFTMASLESWLKTFHPRTIVGTRLAVCDCPLARHLVDLNPGCEATVSNGIGFVTDAKSEKKFKPPKWANKFISDVDSGFTRSRRVTAAEALRLLAGIKNLRKFGGL